MVAYILLSTNRIMGVQLCQCMGANQVTLLMFSILFPYRKSSQSTIYLLLWIFLGCFRGQNWVVEFHPGVYYRANPFKAPRKMHNKIFLMKERYLNSLDL